MDWDCQKLLDEARKQNATHALFIILQTDVLLGQNKIKDAVNAVRSSAIVMPENRALNYKYAEALIRNQDYAQAQKFWAPQQGRSRRADYLSSRQATPGNSLPSRNSREAPPPVEICVILSA